MQSLEGGENEWSTTRSDMGVSFLKGITFVVVSKGNLKETPNIAMLAALPRIYRADVHAKFGTVP